MAKITESYKKYIKDKNESELIEFIKKFTEYAEVFAELPFFNENEEYSFSDTMKRFLQISHTLQLSTVTPIALFFELLLKQEKLSREEYKDSLLLIEKYIIRRSLRGLTTSGYNKTVFNLIEILSKSSNIYNSLADFLSNLKSDTDRFPSDKEISELSFKYFDTKLAKLLLFWIELKQRHSDKEYSDAKEPLKYNFQLEHLMPQAWGQYWVLPIIGTTIPLFDKELLETGKISKSIYEMNDYQFINEINSLGLDGQKINDSWLLRNEKIQELGNFTILSGKLNNSLKNYEWERKLNGDGNKKGIKYYSSLSLNRELCTKYTSEWTEDTITERTQNLKKEIISIW
ncbi:MAG: GmrSD restriction endonuclease domain-containing protein [Brevinema sp.]